MPQDLLLILIAPNVSEQMGGEAIKALQIFREMQKLLPDTVQIAHGRNRAEVARLGLRGVELIDDTAVDRFLWTSVVFRALLDVRYSIAAARLADRIAAERAGGRRVVVHQTEPNSPVTPRALSRKHVNVFGPINGNIYYPPLFRGGEGLSDRLRRRLHLPLQWLNRWLPGGLRRADQILVAGGDRTTVSLLAAGCRPAALRPSLDCGIEQALLDRPRIVHRGRNLRFLHFGRLVYYKGTALAIESLAHARLPIELDIVGDGPELPRCRALVERLGLQQRVRFLGWRSHDALLASFGDYRGVLMPSFGDSNGIAVQEAMAVGLPVVALDWGGPALLVEHGRTGWLVAVGSTEQIAVDLGTHADRLSDDGELADAVSAAARTAALAWCWPTLVGAWLADYPGKKQAPAAA